MSLNALTGLLVCLGVLAVSIMMIIKYVKIKKAKNVILKQNQNDKTI